MNKSSHDEKDTSDQNSVSEIVTSLENGEQDDGKENKLLTSNFHTEIEHRKVEGLITYSFEQQIFKFKVNSGNNHELWRVNADFTSNGLKWTIDAISQQMGFILQQRIHVS